MKHLGYIADADGILLWFSSQNRTFSVPTPYVFGSETVRLWDGERKKETTRKRFNTFRPYYDSNHAYRTSGGVQTSGNRGR